MLCIRLPLLFGSLRALIPPGLSFPLILDRKFFPQHHAFEAATAKSIRSTALLKCPNHGRHIWARPFCGFLSFPPYWHGRDVALDGCMLPALYSRKEPLSQLSFDKRLSSLSYLSFSLSVAYALDPDAIFHTKFRFFYCQTPKAMI